MDYERAAAPHNSPSPLRPSPLDWLLRLRLRAGGSRRASVLVGAGLSALVYALLTTLLRALALGKVGADGWLVGGIVALFLSDAAGGPHARRGSRSQGNRGGGRSRDKACRLVWVLNVKALEHVCRPLAGQGIAPRKRSCGRLHALLRGMLRSTNRSQWRCNLDVFFAIFGMHFRRNVACRLRRSTANTRQFEGWYDPCLSGCLTSVSDCSGEWIHAA